LYDKLLFVIDESITI